MSDPLQVLQLEFMQRAALEIILLSALAGLLGAQIVLRDLAFYTHGVGTATFPGLVAAGPLGVPAAAAALAVAVMFAAALESLERVARIASDAAVALLLVGALALGVVLASDVFESGSEVDQLLFGTLLAIGDAELAFTAGALGVVAAAFAVYRRTWLANGFDAGSSHSLGLRPRAADRVLFGAIAIAVVASLDAIGALLVGAMLVIPAATVRPFVASVHSLGLATGALALVEGLAGLWLAYELDVPPGATIAALGGVVFAAAAAVSVLRRAIGTGATT